MPVNLSIKNAPDQIVHACANEPSGTTGHSKANS